ncbi:hypothetical protein K504DRAFT_351493, partial [Pleomassaria siparia CBS 279.74]
TAALILGAAPAVLAHTWVSQLRTINQVGEYIGEYGYPRNFLDTSDAGYNGETSMTYLVPPVEQQPPFINSTNLLCNPNLRKPVQNPKYPRLQATPGVWIALRYAENGHTSNPSNLNGHTPGTLDLGRRPNGGTVFIFGTTEPKEDEKIADVLQWTQDGNGGDKRGLLLATQNYDDGRCYQVNQSPVTKERMALTKNYRLGQPDGPGNYELPCEADVQLPKDAPVGKPLSLYWVWNWAMDPTENNPNANPTFPKGKDEYYTTCMDVDIVDAIKTNASAKFALAQQDSMEVAVRNYKSRTAQFKDPIAAEVGPVFKSNSSDSQPSVLPTAKPTTIAPSPPQTTLATSIGVPSLNSTGKPTIEIPTLTVRPGDKPTSLPNDDDVVTVIVTERVTVTA